VKADCINDDSGFPERRPVTGWHVRRCAQATHHPRHRPIWAEHTEQTKTFLGSLGPTRRSERARLQADHDRTSRVIADIDIAANTDTSDDRE